MGKIIHEIRSCLEKRILFTSCSVFLYLCECVYLQADQIANVNMRLMTLLTSQSFNFYPYNIDPFCVVYAENHPFQEYYIFLCQNEKNILLSCNTTYSKGHDMMLFVRCVLIRIINK